MKEFIDIQDPGQTRKILKAVGELENNRGGLLYPGIFHPLFWKFKTFQSMLGVVGKILTRFGEGLEDMDIYGSWQNILSITPRIMYI